MIHLPNAVSKKSIGCLWSIISICLVIFTGTSTSTHANNFYGTGSLKPMVKESETTIYFPGGAKLATESDEARYSLTDHLNSTRLAVASDNEVSRATDYTPFGDTPSDTTLTTEAGQYTGQAYEPETATYDYHARSYDPTVARFTAVDTLRQTPGSYTYVSNNPINRIDPSGNFSRRFEALDLAITPRQKTMGPKFDGVVGGRSGEVTPSPLARATQGTHTEVSGPPTGLTPSPLETPLARRLMAIHTDPKNSARVDAVRSIRGRRKLPDSYLREKKVLYSYATKPKKIWVVDQNGKINTTEKVMNKFNAFYTPNSIEFFFSLRDPESVFYATDVVRDQYLEYIQEVGDVKNDIRYIIRKNVRNKDVKAFLAKHHGEAPKGVFLEGFLRVKGNGRSTKRILDEFNLRATDISVDYGVGLNITIHVEPRM